MSNGGWGHGGAATEVFWESPCSTEPDYFGILSFQPKIFACKTIYFIKNQIPKGWPFMFGIDSVGKYSVQNWIFIDWSVTMAIGGASGGPGWFWDMCICILTIHGVPL